MDRTDRMRTPAWPRRKVLAFLSATGVATAPFARALAALANGQAAVTSEMIDEAEWITGIDLTPAERDLMTSGINELLADFRANRAVPLDRGVAPALRFDPEAGRESPRDAGSAAWRPPRDAETANAGANPEDDLAFAGIARLSGLLRARQVSPSELASLAFERMARFDPVLRCVIAPTRDLAREQARAAEARIAAGESEPLIGIPWGAKDLLAVPGVPTTWGAAPFRDQTFREEATVVRRLREAGAVLTSKLALGALAWGDVWFGGRTRNPWDPSQGSSGSSAGPASAVAAGIVPFALGSETWGSIVSPCTRCGVTGLRPTFGRVSRYGAMALSWTMDKIGPIARSAEDCRLVFRHLFGRDARDPDSVDRPYDERRGPDDVAGLRIGVVEAAFAVDRAEGVEDDAERAELDDWAAADRAALRVVEGLGATLVPIRVPERFDVSPLSLILTAEAATAFDDLTRTGADDRLTRQIEAAWPNVLRQGQMIPAVEYLRASRLRRSLMDDWKRVFETVDVLVTPSLVGDTLLATNLTGHPQVVVPSGFTASGHPVSLSIVGRLWGEGDLLAVAEAFQLRTDFHRRRPNLDVVLSYREET